jgi:CRP/FNR family transcriptional regulator, anaerobic regulatory protein
MISAQLFPFLAEIGAVSRERLAAGLRRIACEDGSPLIQRGDPVAGAYLVERGALRVYYITAEGREGTLYWVEPGQSCILALNCAFSRLAYPAFVESEGETVFSVIPGPLYRDLFAQEASVQRFTFDALSGRLFELMGLIEEASSLGLEARLAAFLIRRAKDAETLKLTQEQIAGHLGTSREVVSRLLRRLVAAGLIDTGLGWVAIRDPDGLVRLAA